LLLTKLDKIRRNYFAQNVIDKLPIIYIFLASQRQEANMNVVTKLDAMRALGLSKENTNKTFGYLTYGYTDADLLQVVAFEADKNGPQSFRDLFRNYGPSPRGRKESFEMRHAMVRLAEAGLIAYETKIGVGRPTVKWFPTDEGKAAQSLTR
jgi:hypothetical protein